MVAKILKKIMQMRNTMKTDPISGHDVDNYLDHCSLIVGNVKICFDAEENCKKICFDAEENCKTFKAMPFDHPNLHLPCSASVDDDRGV
jgi:hypothetical protein